MKRLIVGIFSLLVFGQFSLAQDSVYARQIIKELSSETYFGRGYNKGGVQKAAYFLADEMKKLGLKSYSDSYLQEMSYYVNIFPGDYQLEIDGKEFTPSLDYIIDPETGNIEGNFKLYSIPIEILKDSAAFCNISPKKTKRKFVILRLDQLEDKKHIRFIKSKVSDNFLNSRGYIIVQDHYPIWSIASEKKDFAIIRFNAKSFPDKLTDLYLNIENKTTPVTSHNVIGYIPGKTNKTIVFSAHYDHLGGIGDSLFFPGAQDNASGVAMCLDLARHFSKETPDFNVVFMLFTGEEAGLLGSSYYNSRPLFPLEKIDFLINLDMVGTGEKGITIVNAKDSTYSAELNLFEKINRQDSLNLKIQPRGISANSDHHPFNESGVKAIFIYSKGGNTFYHHVRDRQETVSLNAYNRIFHLISEFAEQYER